MSSLERGRTAVVHLVRHGEVENPHGVLYGRAPGFLLSDVGLQMALAAAKTLAHRDLAAVWSSPMERAVQTAELIAGEHNLPVWEDHRLTEAASLLEGSRATLDKSVVRQPRVWRHLWNPWRPSWGEPYRAVADRMWQAVADAVDDAVGREVVLVGHQLPIWLLRRQARGQRLVHHPRRRECALASVTSITLSAGRVVAVAYEDPWARLQ